MEMSAKFKEAIKNVELKVEGTERKNRPPVGLKFRG